MRKSVIAIIIIVLVVLYMSVFVVKEGERGITLRFGKVLRDDDNKPLVYEPGLHFKIPFIETVKMLDARIHAPFQCHPLFVRQLVFALLVQQ